MPSNESWQKVRFDEICKNISKRIDDPKQAETDYYVGLEHLDSEDPKISRHGSPQDVSKTKLIFKSGHILFGRRNWYLRRLAVAQREGICSAHMMVLEHIDGKCIKEFVPLLMFSDDFYEKALMVSAGSMSPTIKWKDIATLEFLIPSIAQQENILSITHKIDQTISDAQNLLEKTKNYLISRRESLLTRGIGHTKFKKVPWYYGKTIEIPEEWEMISIKESDIKVIDGDRGNEYPNADEFLDQGYCLFLSTKNVTKKGFSFKECSFISKEKDEKLRKGRLSREDIVITTRGTIGNIAYFERTIPYDIIRINSGMVILRNFNDSLSQKFLYHTLQSSNIIKQFNRSMYGSAQPQLTISIINSLKLIIPRFNEQQKIVSILSNIDNQIIQQQSHLNNLKVLRKSILNSKLTKEKTNVAN